MRERKRKKLTTINVTNSVAKTRIRDLFRPHSYPTRFYPPTAPSSPARVAPWAPTSDADSWFRRSEIPTPRHKEREGENKLSISALAVDSSHQPLTWRPAPLTGQRPQPANIGSRTCRLARWVCLDPWLGSVNTGINPVPVSVEGPWLSEGLALPLRQCADDKARL